MKNITRLSYLVVLLMASQILTGQSLKAFMKAAEESYTSKDYYSALTYYSNAAEFDSTNVEVGFNLAESARLFSAYALAEMKYDVVMENDEKNEYPLALFWSANMKQKQGKYPEAKQAYEMYLAENSGDDEYYTAKAEKEMKACEWAIEKLENPDGSITLTHLEGGINTEYSEFGGLSTEDGLYYSSLKFPDEASPKSPKKLLSKMLLSESGDTEGELVEDEVNKPNFHTAHTTFNRDNTRMYYTICDYFLGNDIKCNLYYRDISADGTFGAETMLPENINLQSNTSTQPAFGYDANTDKSYLYYATDRAGGKGKMDIWYTEILASGFGEPMNAEDINTNENDITPYFHNATNALYFSSDGYQGLGGFDIYKTSLSQEGWSEASHLNNPINSSFNDVYYTLTDDSRTSHFSSDRLESAYVDSPSEACCYDIYKAEFEEVNIMLNAQTFIKETQDSLINASVRVIDLANGFVVCEQINTTGIDHKCLLEKDKEYMVIGDKYGMKSDTIYVSTKGIYESQEITKKLYLERGDVVKVTLDIVDDATGAPLENATVTIIDLDDPSNPDVVLENVNGQAVFDLEANKKYKIIVEAEGFEPQTIIIDTNTEGLGGEISKEVRMKKRDLNIYLPLSLYFDNDYPKASSRAVVSNKNYSVGKRLSTKKTYSETYVPYASKKDKYKDRTARNMQGEEKLIAQQRMDDFFEFDVRGGYEKMNLFLQSLVQKLGQGNTFEIQIKGYASPIATKAYNKSLATRRVHSVQNELNQYADGLLTEYMENGSLVITDVSFGESEAPSNVNDSASNTKESIFSVDASKERRVEVIKISDTTAN